MTYDRFLEIVLSDNVYDAFKENEQEIFALIPEMRVCKGFAQNNKWHIYDVYEHILHVVAGVENNKCLRLAAVFHDVGKPPAYTEDENGVGHFFNHWNESLSIFKKYEDRIGLKEEEVSLIENLIFYHDINFDRLDDEEIKNMTDAIGLGNMGLLFALKRADLLAQSPEFHGLLSNIDKQEQTILRQTL